MKKISPVERLALTKKDKKLRLESEELSYNN